MATDYIPQKDADFGPWLANLAALSTAAPATYGLTAPEAAAITALRSLKVSHGNTKRTASNNKKPASADGGTANRQVAGALDAHERDSTPCGG
jgi:hypothetical protein